MVDELARNRTLQDWRERRGVVTAGLPGELRGVALTALCRPGEIAGP
jgi:hypothetical protein